MNKNIRSHLASNCIFLWAFIFLFNAGCAQVLTPADIEKYSFEKLSLSIDQYREFLSISNIGSNKRDVQNNVEWCVKTFKELGFKTEILWSDTVPHVLASKTIDPALETILFYLQIDGQPVDNAEWDQADPFIAVMKKFDNGEWKSIKWADLNDSFDPDWRIYARSSSDSKGPAMAFISALQILKAHNLNPAFNIKVIMDFQEELGSPTLPALVKRRKEDFEAKYLLVMDGTRHLSNLPTLTFGARGIATVRLTTYGALRDLHSGQYGNFAPNPAFHLSRLLGSMKDEYGRVLIPGFYEGVTLSDEEKRLINSLPEDMDTIKKSLGLAIIDSVGNTYQEALQFPSLNIRGLKAAWTGENVRTILPKEAVAEIDMRLVPETPAERQIQLLKKFIKEQGYYITDSFPTLQERFTYPKIIQFNYRIGSKPFRTEMNSPMGKWLSRSLGYIYGDRFVKMRTTGGSQPMAPFITTLDLPAVSVRIPNPDNNIHAPNENLRLGNYLEGIEMCLSILLHSIN